MANYMNRKRDGAGAKLPKRMITRPGVFGLDMPNIELVKPTTQAERREIYNNSRKVVNAAKLTKPRQVQMPQSMSDVHSHVIELMQKSEAALIRIKELESRVTDLELESNNRVNSIAHINARIDWIPKMETHLKLLTQRVWALENEIHHITPAKQENRDLMRSFANDVKTRVPPIPAVNNEAAKSIYEIQKLLTNAVNALEQIRK